MCVAFNLVQHGARSSLLERSYLDQHERHGRASSAPLWLCGGTASSERPQDLPGTKVRIK